MMPISGSSKNGCDCPGTTPVSGVLIDGVIPSIDTTQHGTWASELFVVNRNGQNSFKIGFDFQTSSSYLRGIEIVLFYCPVQGFGISGVKVYSSSIFPDLFNIASTLHVTHNSLPIDNCQSLSTISIPVQLSLASSTNYFIEFLFTGGSSIHQLNWLHLAEIRFSDETRAIMPNAMISLATTTEHLLITSSHSTAQSSTTKEDLLITGNKSSGISQSSIATVSISGISPSIEPVQVITNSESEIPIPSTTTVVTLAGIIGLLFIIILMIGGCPFFLCFIFYRKHKLRALNEKQNPLPTFTNVCYSSRRTLELPDLLTVYYNPKFYGDIGNSGLYDDIGEDHYELIPEAVKTDSADDIGQVTPVMPNESESLKQPFDNAQSHQNDVNLLLHNIPVAQVGVHKKFGDSEEVREIQGEEDYIDMRGRGTAAGPDSQSSIQSTSDLKN